MTTRTRLTPDETADLIRRAGAGDSLAWRRLVDGYSGVIWAVTRGFRLCDADANDVVQSTWLRLLEHLDSLNDPTRVGAWLATTARRECLRTVAMARRTRLVGDDEHLLESVDLAQPEVDARMIRAEQATAVRRAVQSLPQRWRDLMLALMADPAPSYEEVSERLGIPVGSIGPTRGRALHRLHELLEAVSPLAAAAS